MKEILVRNDDIIWRRIEDQIIIIRIDGLATYTLNKTASRIWELCDGTKGIDEITAALCTLFDVLTEEAGADIRETISKFEEMKLLERKRKQT